MSHPDAPRFAGVLPALVGPRMKAPTEARPTCWNLDKPTAAPVPPAGLLQPSGRAATSGRVGAIAPPRPIGSRPGPTPLHLIPQSVVRKGRSARRRQRKPQ